MLKNISMEMSCPVANRDHLIKISLEFLIWIQALEYGPARGVAVASSPTHFPGGSASTTNLTLDLHRIM